MSFVVDDLEVHEETLLYWARTNIHTGARSPEVILIRALYFRSESSCKLHNLRVKLKERISEGVRLVSPASKAAPDSFNDPVAFIVSITRVGGTF